ncbi:Uncharacterised protein [Mycobacteroides abscessus subsp. bolletii]|nr:Uncharacterised protein [Mycobacteroides abscessus subsp. bolletii]
MTAQAITDIKELVGEMPARGCEWQPYKFIAPECSLQARWAIRLHLADWATQTCSVGVQHFCDAHKQELLAIIAEDMDAPCESCGVVTAAVFKVMPL